MSYKTWNEYGYGIVVDDIETTKERLMALVHLAPSFEEELNEWINDCMDGEEAELEDILEYEDDSCYCGLGVILHKVIYEVEDIELTLCEDYDCKQYLMFTPTYPWYMGEKTKNFKEEDIEELFRKFVSVLTDDEISIEYLDCENGG